MGKKVGGNNKGGKFVNPTDRARKEERKRELKKNKKQRIAVRSAVIKGKDPHQILADLERLDSMEFNVSEPSPLNDSVLSNKRRKLMETWDRLLKLYVKEDKNKFSQLKRLETEYDQKRTQLKKNYEAVKSALNVDLDQIPLPSLPEGPTPVQGLKAPSLTARRVVTDREPPGPPPGLPPSLDEFDEAEDKSNKLKAESEVDAFLKEIEAEVGPSLPSSSMVPGIGSKLVMLTPPVATSGAMIPPPNIPGFQPQIPCNFIPPSFTQTRTMLPQQRAVAVVTKASQPEVERGSRHGVTIEAKPQLRNLTGDATRFVPTSLRIKKNERQPVRPHTNQIPTPVAPSSTSTGQTKDDAYEQFMKELQGLI